MQLAVSRKNQLTFAAAGLVAGATVVAIRSLTRGNDAKPIPFAIRASVVVDRSPEDVYRYWRDFKNLAGFLPELVNVAEFEGTCVWTVRGPSGVALTWDAEIVADRRNERIAWRSLEGATLPNHGSVTFKSTPYGRGTDVEVEFAFESPLGPVGTAVVQLFGRRPERQLRQALRRLKRVLDMGATGEAQIAAD